MRAGYRASDSNGAWLARKQQIRQRVAELSGLAAQRAAITKEKLIEMAEEVYLKAKEAGQFSAAIGTVREIGSSPVCVWRSAASVERATGLARYVN
jgi:hypothetical protein